MHGRMEKSLRAPSLDSPSSSPDQGGTSTIPISYPNILLGKPTISANFVGAPSEVRP